MTKYKNVKTVGKVSWAKVFEFNREKEGYKGAYLECDGAYTINQHLTKEEYQKLKDAGTMKKPIQKFLLDGEIVIKHERKHLIPAAPQAGGAPLVIDRYGREWDTDNWGLIGNDSVCEIESLISTFEIPDDKGGKREVSRTTMKVVKVLEAKVYNAETKTVEDFTPPAPSGDWKKDKFFNEEQQKVLKEEPKVEDEYLPDVDLDDEIPF